MNNRRMVLSLLVGVLMLGVSASASLAGENTGVRVPKLRSKPVTSTVNRSFNTVTKTLRPRLSGLNSQNTSARKSFTLPNPTLAHSFFKPMVKRGVQSNPFRSNFAASRNSFKGIGAKRAPKIITNLSSGRMQVGR